MSRQITKAAGNVYCQARLRAAQYNDKLQTRAGASRVIPGVTEDSIKKYELDIADQPNDVVALMADAEPQETRKIAERGASVAFAPIMQTDAFKRYMDGLKAAGVSALT